MYLGRMFGQAHQRVNRALRQEQRMQAAHAAEIAERERVGFRNGIAPESVEPFAEEFRDELYFFILAVRQAIAARAVLVDHGVDLPPVDREDALTAWRHMYEHFDDDLRGTPLRARALWERSGAEGEPGQNWSFNGDHGITSISGISIGKLRDDLSALRDAMTEAMANSFEREWLTIDGAAEFMRMDRTEFDRLAGINAVLLLDFEWKGGVRVRTSDLERWRDRLIARDEWPSEQT